MIIGLTGSLGAGKSVVAELLKEKDFSHYSVRDFLVKELKARNILINRASMVLLANELREKNSPDYIVEQLYEKAIKENKDAVIESIRTLGEVESLRKKESFFLIAVDADQKIRYERIFKRQNETDNITFEKFIEDEAREMNSNNPNKGNIRKCIELSDFKLTNNGSIEELNKKLEDVYHRIKNNDLRPSWDEYFMDIAHTVAKRSSCNRGKVGCVIAKDKRILVTGYAGSPIGLPHCDKIGHQMKTLVHEDGTQTQHCTRTTHAEQNAICQAAKMGISIDGATLYCKMTPCSTCTKSIINSGIKRVVCEKKYHASLESEELFKKADIKLEILNDETAKYADQ